MNTYHISKRYSTKEQYYASPEFKEVYRGYENNIPSTKRVDANFIFLGGYVVTVDPTTNYGQPFKLFQHYQCRDGLKCLKEESVISVLSTAPLCHVTLVGDIITIRGDVIYDKNDKSRKRLIEDGITVY